MTYHSLLGELTPSGKLLSLLNDTTSKPSTGILYQRARSISIRPLDLNFCMYDYCINFRTSLLYL